MTPHPYQREYLTAIAEGWKQFSKQLAVAPTGSGKGPMFAWTAEPFVKAGKRALLLVDQDELVKQGANKFREILGIEASIEKAESFASLGAQVVVGSVQTLMREKRLERWPEDHFGIVLADEADKCFVHDTLVVTDKGPMRIGDIVNRRQSLFVLSCDLSDNSLQWKPVTNWFKKPITDTYLITHEQGQFECSGNHKIWTEDGYVWAENLVSGNYLRALPKAIPANQELLEAVPVLQQTMQREMDSFTARNKGEVVGQKQGASHHCKMRALWEIFFSKWTPEKKSLLFKTLFAAMGWATAARKGASASHGFEMGKSTQGVKASRFFRPNENQQSHLDSGEFGKDEVQAAWTHVLVSWWKRQINRASKAFGLCFELANGVPYSNAVGAWSIPFIARLLQGGFGVSATTNRGRGGRQFASFSPMAVPRPPQDGNFKRSRVVSVKIQKRGSNDGPSFGSFENQFLYDIEVDGNHNYFANGALVSNSIAPSWMRVMKRFDGHAKVCGYTATPWRTDQRNLGEYYENVIEIENLKSLIQKGFLAPIKIQQLPIVLDAGSRGNGKDFTDDEADEIITPHLEEIAKAILQHCSFRRTLVFLPLIRTCEKFTEIAREVGLAADYVYGEDPERHTKLNRFRAWDFDVLSNSMLLTRGVDIPAVDAIVPCRPTKSVTLYFQMVGRGTRIAEGKTDCLLLDFLYQATKRLICRPAHLIAKSPEEAEEMIKLSEFAGLPGEVIEQLDLIEVAAEASTVREEALKKKLEEQKNKKAKTISAAEFAMQHGSLATAEFEPVMKWEAEKVSDKQARYLAEAGIDIDTVKGKGHASKLLDIYFPTKPLKLASFGQRQKMKQMGYANWANATAREAGQFFAQLNKNRAEVMI